VQVRPDARINKRLPCRVKVAGTSFGGMVLNVSRSGLFVQTTARVDPGAEMWLELNPSAQRDVIELGAQVIWKRVVDARLRGVASGGVGLKIHSAPESYYTFLMRLMAVAPQTKSAETAEASETDKTDKTDETGNSCRETEREVVAAADAAEPQSFRVRLKQEQGSRSRTLTLSCSSEAEARDRALEQVGPGWVVLESASV